jgi:hypothetical protein
MNLNLRQKFRPSRCPGFSPKSLSSLVPARRKNFWILQKQSAVDATVIRFGIASDSATWSSMTR